MDPLIFSIRSSKTFLTIVTFDHFFLHAYIFIFSFNFIYKATLIIVMEDALYKMYYYYYYNYYSYRGSKKTKKIYPHLKHCNSRWRYKGSKFKIIPYKPFKICPGSFSLELTKNERDLYWAVSNIHPLFFGWELQLRCNFSQGHFFKEAPFENSAKSHNFTNLFVCDITL